MWHSKIIGPRPQCRNTHECPAATDLVLVSLSFGQIKITCGWSVSHTGVSQNVLRVGTPGIHGDFEAVSQEARRWHVTPTSDCLTSPKYGNPA